MARSEKDLEDFRNWQDDQSGYIGKEAKADWWRQRGQDYQNAAGLRDIFGPTDPNPGGPTYNMAGASTDEAAGRIAGLQRAKILTGQNPYEIGADYQQAYGNIRKRSQGVDTGSELLRASKAGAVADTRNELQRQGVKGGAAIGAASAVERQKSYDVNNQLMESQRRAEMDYLNATKANANFTTAQEMNFGALAAGQELQAPAQYNNGFGTVICTELYRQGYYSREIYELDQDYGLEILFTRPNVYWGYRFWADPLVGVMRKSPRFTRAVAFFAVPWAQNMAYGNNKFGALLSFIFEPVCGLVGYLIRLGGNHAHQKT